MKGHQLHRWVVAAAGALVVWGSAGATLQEGKTAEVAGPGHLLALGDDGRWGRLQRPTVRFDHDAHTRALRGRECDACHRLQDRVNGKEIRIYGFPRETALADRHDLMDAYHAACVGCHQERRAQRLASGPVICGQCHPAAPAAGKIWHSVRFDYAVHHKHAEAAQSRCEVCHHEYDEAQKKLVYKKGAEASCRDCHGLADEESRRSFRRVAHAQCLDCHMKREKEGQKAGPRTCGGCHGERRRATPQEMAALPRLSRGQKDTVEMKVEGGRTKAVVFNHKDHEPRVAFCSDCHHRTHQRCSACHTGTGSREGAGINLADAFHQPRSALSCVGCHARKAEAPSCRGCHQFRAKGPSQSSCPICHSGPAGPQTVAALERFMAELPEEKVPEKAEMKLLEREYKPAWLPHRKVVRALLTPPENRKLAERFHSRTGAVCLGCHHRAPWDLESKLPGCPSCHGTLRDSRWPGRPALLGAYHQQCMGCHEVMKLKAVGCADCHEEKPQAAGADAPGDRPQ
jgi:hypothetical protein